LSIGKLIGYDAESPGYVCFKAAAKHFGFKAQTPIQTFATFYCEGKVEVPARILGLSEDILCQLQKAQGFKSYHWRMGFCPQALQVLNSALRRRKLGGSPWKQWAQYQQGESIHLWKRRNALFKAEREKRRIVYPWGKNAKTYMYKCLPR